MSKQSEARRERRAFTTTARFFAKMTEAEMDEFVTKS